MSVRQKKTIESVIDVLSGGAMVEIENYPVGVLNYLPEGSPVEPIAGTRNLFKLLKGLIVTETATGVTQKIGKVNFINIGDTIEFDSSAVVTAVDRSNSEYDVITVDTSVTGTLGVVYGETIAGVAYVTDGIIYDIDESSVATKGMVSAGILTKGTIKKDKMNLYAPITDANIAKGIIIYENIFA